MVEYDRMSIWTLYEGIKRDDSTPVSIFHYESNPSPSSSSSSSPYAENPSKYFPLARNSLRKLRTLRHPNILKFLDGTETDTSIYIITEPIKSLSVALKPHREREEVAEESKIYGLLHLATALSFLNKEGGSIHGNVKSESIFMAQGGEWKVGGMELCTKKDDEEGVIWNMASYLPDARLYSSPEVRKVGWSALKEHDAAALDSYQLHLLLYTLFNGPLPVAFSGYSEVPPALPNVRGSIPASLFQVWRRLGNPNPRPRLKTDSFLELGMGSITSGGGWWPSNRLVKLSAALEGFALASEGEKAALIRTLKEVDGQKFILPEAFLKYKVLPSLVQAFEFGGGGPTLLPLILSLADSLPEKEYTSSIIGPLIRMFATPDRAMRMALLEGLDKFADKLTSKDVTERIWPHLLTGFSDVVPVIREATVKSVLLIAPKLNDRILNNDLLRHLGKTQTDPEAGIRTNTCILLGRLSRLLQPATQRKVLIPAFARALRDPFIHARIAGLMALMATADCYEKEDLAGRVIPAMAICLVDREKAVRDQGYKAMDMFIKKCEALTANMPETLVVENGAQSGSEQAARQNQPALATNAAGAAGALAGWAFASVQKTLSAAELKAPIDPRASPVPPNISGGYSNGNGSINTVQSNSNGRSNGVRAPIPSIPRPPQVPSTRTIPGGFGIDTEEEEDQPDWGGDLMDVNDDDDDWEGFESGQPAPAPKVDPFAARLSVSKPKVSNLGKKAPMKLGMATKSSALRVPMDMDAGDNWDLEEDASARSPLGNIIKPKTIAVPRVSSPITRPSSASSSNPISQTPSPTLSPKPKPKPVLQTRPPAPIVRAPIITARPSPVAQAEETQEDDEDWGNFDDKPIEKEKVAAVSSGGTKEERAAKMAAAREERRARMAKLKG